MIGSTSLNWGWVKMKKSANKNNVCKYKRTLCVMIIIIILNVAWIMMQIHECLANFTLKYFYKPKPNDTEKKVKFTDIK